MRIIDCHLHTQFAPGDWFVSCADQRGYEAYCVLSLSFSPLCEGDANNARCLEAKVTDPKRAYAFAGLIYPCEDPLQHIQKWLQKGADGVKLIETKPTAFKEVGADLSDERFEPMFAYLEAHQVPIIWHVGDPATFWKADEAPKIAFERGWFYGDGSYASLESLYAIAEKVLKRHPKLRACFAHLYFCGDDRKHAEWLLDTYENTYLDITPGTEMYEWFAKDLPGWKAFFERYQDRIMLGSDDAANTKLSAHGTYELALSALGKGEMDYYGTPFGPSLGLDEEVAEKIACHNFRAFAGETPKPVKL